eukprot:NODE_142_length_2220_cov_310.188392_g115_i0.p1 GENE.NODE_142_length_2220_cov_310.188392_g115_i0~~NODE_142_length_2220_cov_310.188392_g115_i0.p1  ORF type:complete len:574 (-),score=96.07 NODE_142_length_2220_cov_310.188392_g115_i0:388-2109(-)
MTAKPWIGFAVRKAPGKAAILVVDVADEGPAARAGLNDGDELVSFAGVRTPTMDKFRTAFQTHAKPGAALQLEFIRGGSQLPLHKAVTLHVDARHSVVPPPLPPMQTVADMEAILQDPRKLQATSDHMFLAADENNSGLVDRREFAAAMRATVDPSGRHFQPAEADQLFDRADTDHSGFLVQSEFGHVTEAILRAAIANSHGGGQGHAAGHGHASAGPIGGSMDYHGGDANHGVPLPSGQEPRTSFNDYHATSNSGMNPRAAAYLDDRGGDGTYAPGPTPNHAAQHGHAAQDGAFVPDMNYGAVPLVPMPSPASNLSGISTSSQQHRYPDPCIAVFLARNPDITMMKKKRDKFQGPLKFIKAAIFAFLLFSPVLTIIPDLGSEGWVIAFLWILIALIMIFYIEYWARAECWYTCICRGIILDFRKTDKLMRWACNPIMWIAYTFIITAGVLTGLAKEGSTKDRIITGCLFVLGLLFVISLTKTIVDLEGSNRLQTVNLILAYFSDPELLRAKGFKMIHETQLARWQKTLKENHAPFSWDQLFALSHVPCDTKMALFWGMKTTGHLRKHKDLDS